MVKTGVLLWTGKADPKSPVDIADAGHDNGHARWWGLLGRIWDGPQGIGVSDTTHRAPFLSELGWITPAEAKYTTLSL
jgi:hypothetical protein